MADGTLGSIAGSVLTLDQAVRNVMEWNIVTAEQGIRMASEVAAKSAGIDDICGMMLPGRSADFNVLDTDLMLVDTFIGGRQVQK